ncbi:DUF3500 domain-containing protein [Pararhodobacter marinus]|uniref:DUF3500 domain-containing protein n=1 Tax=Pararhodobacter marinus TaxID=2184063 RepID=UPI0035120958
MTSPNKTLQPLTDEKLKAAFGQMAHPRDFRPFVPAQKAAPELNSTRHQRTAEVMAAPFFQGVRAAADQAIAEPFRGITTDGTLRPPVRALTPNGAPKAAMEAAATALIATLRPEIAAQVLHPVDAPEWRRWHNMPMCWPQDGVGLEEMNEPERAAVMALLRASVSDWGYRHLLELMEINRFSGVLIGREKYLNEHCYTVGLFGTPGSGDWGWQIYGHHLCLSIRLIGETYVMAPTLLAAEPTVVDEGQAAGIDAFLDTEQAATALMQALPPALAAKAQVAPSILNADLPEGRRHWSDSLHLGGAFRDNQVIPREGLNCAELGAEDRARLMALIETFYRVQPDGPRAARLAEIEAHLDQTHLCWMGGYDDWSPFYFRLHSPVTLIEFDHHQAVFLTNAEPARFHVHTITRIPEGGDYGRDLAALKGNLE